MYDDRLRKSEWTVKLITIALATSLVKKYHYAQGATLTGVYVHGLFRVNDLESCLGVAWWLPPTKAAAVATYPEGDWRKVLSLTRLVIVPDVPKNACSFLLSRSMKLIDPEKWECLVTYADTWQNHIGTIYKATNWEYLGLTAKTHNPKTPDHLQLSPSFSKFPHHTPNLKYLFIPNPYLTWKAHTLRATRIMTGGGLLNFKGVRGLIAEFVLRKKKYHFFIVA